MLRHTDVLCLVFIFILRPFFTFPDQTCLRNSNGLYLCLGDGQFESGPNHHPYWHFPWPSLAPLPKCRTIPRLGHHFLRNRYNYRKRIPMKLHTLAEEKMSLWTRRHNIMVTLQIQKCDISSCWIAQLCSSCNLSDLYLGSSRFEYRPGKFLFFYFSWYLLVPPSPFWDSSSSARGPLHYDFRHSCNALTFARHAIWATDKRRYITKQWTLILGIYAYTTCTLMCPLCGQSTCTHSRVLGVRKRDLLKRSLNSSRPSISPRVKLRDALWGFSIFDAVQLNYTVCKPTTYSRSRTTAAGT